jgi:anaerobic magnesium-protoporphyrin IX monomethyl ester cyclase
MASLYSHHKISPEKNKGKVVLFFPSFGLDEADNWMPFPYLYLAPFMEKAGFEVSIVDARVESEWELVLENELKDAFACGITSMSGPDLDYAAKAAKIARGMKNDITVIWGGHHVSALPDEVFNEDVADFVFLGPAEFSFPVVLDCIFNKKEIPDDMKGVLYKKDGKILGNKNVNAAVFDYDDKPAYHLIDVEKYRSKNNIAAYFKTRGCPFKCTFCATGNFNVSDKTIKQYSDEIKYIIKDLGFRSICFRDPTFFLKACTVMDVAELIHSTSQSMGEKIKWKGQARGTFHRQYKPEQFEFMKKSGLSSVMFGVESGSQRMLDFMVKKVRRDEYIKSAKVLADLGIEMYASFMFAMPGETVDDLKESIALMHELKAINPNILLQNCIFIPLPATKMFKDAIALGYTPPTTLKGWSERNISSRFSERNDITWMKKSLYDEYVKIYNNEFGHYKHAWEKENDGEYVNPMAAPQHS